MVTEARFFVKTRGRKALRLKLPEGTRLWESRVGRTAVSARVDQGETLIPLPASINPSTPVRVELRLGQTSTDPKKPSISSPIMLVPTLINSWQVSSDPDRRLTPTANNTAELAHETEGNSGFEAILADPLPPLGLALALVVGACLCCCAKSGGVRQFLGLLVFAGAAIWAGVLVPDAIETITEPSETLEFAAPVIEAGETLTLELSDSAKWQGYVSNLGISAVIIGLLLLLLSFVLKRNADLGLIAWILIAYGLLAQPGGFAFFLIGIAAFTFLYAVLPVAIDWISHCNRHDKGDAEPGDTPDDTDPDADPEPGAGGTVTAASMILLLACAIGLSPGHAQAASQAAPVADTAKQTLRIEDGRLFGQLELSVTGRASDTLQLLHAPVVLTQFQGEGLRVTKRSIDGGKTEYWAVLERDGTSTATLSYELPVPDISKGFTLPTGAAAVQHVEIRVDQPGWDISSDKAVKSTGLPDLADGTSGTHLILGPSPRATIKMQPKTRDLAAEEATFFAEVSNLFVPGPGIVDGRHHATIRPSRGQLSTLDLVIPDGFTVSDVLASNLTSWRFDPDAKSLQLEFSPAHSKPFALLVETQQGSAPLPTDISLSPISIVAAEGQVGTLGVAFAGDAQLEKATPQGLSRVNQDDFDHSLLKRQKDGPAIGTLNQTYRYGAELGSLALTVAPVAPDIRAHTIQTLSLGEERLVMAIDLTVNITRSGIFNLSFPIPDGLDIEAVSGDALASHVESRQDGQRVATLQLNGRTIGQQKFAITLAGAAPGAQDSWTVPKFGLREASRHTGQLLVVPEQGIRTEAAAREHASPLDARKLSNSRPGTLAFRLLQSDWKLDLRIEALDPWVTAQVLQDVTAREGITRSHLGIAYRVENAAIKSLQVQLPGLSEEEQRTVRASGNAVSHIAKLDAGDDLWEVHFQRRILGTGKIDIDYQRTTDRADDIENISAAKLVGAKQSASWVAVRVSGHLEVSLVNPQARGWQSSDWSGVPKTLLNARNRAVPALAFRAVDPDQPLTVKVQRHSIAEALRLSVLDGDFTTVVAPDGASVTQAVMTVKVVEKSTLRVVLPVRATLINAFVNGRSPGIVRENGQAEAADNAYLFYVFPREDGSAATVSIAWSNPSAEGDFQLTGPRLNVPLQNVEWHVILPNSVNVHSYKGNLDQVREAFTHSYGFAEYRAETNHRLTRDIEDANRLMEQANEWKARGDQEKARSAYSKLANQGNLDQATSEDARVQLRALQEERTLLSLATRRQRNYFDNRSEDPTLSRNEGLEQAADNNPFLQGQTNYSPDQLGTLLAGNTSEETSALKRITARLVSQQLAAEPAPQAIAINIPKHGQVLTFHRSVQVDGEAPLELKLKVGKKQQVHIWLLIPIALLLAFVLRATGKRKAEQE